jgi:hypothetical protein
LTKGSYSAVYWHGERYRGIGKKEEIKATQKLEGNIESADHHHPGSTVERKRRTGRPERPMAMDPKGQRGFLDFFLHPGR